MSDLTSAVNNAAELADLDIDSPEGTENAPGSPVMATPTAFMGGVVVSAALVTAYEAGRAHGAGDVQLPQ